MSRLMGCCGAPITAALNINPRHQCIRLIARSGDGLLVDVVALVEIESGRRLGRELAFNYGIDLGRGRGIGL